MIDPFDDIDTLLHAASEDIAQIEQMYQQSLANQTVPPRLRADIKNVLENQRSALDYLAVAITKRFGQPTGQHIYYPLADSEANFAKTIDAKMLGVTSKRKPIAKKIGEHQPYNTPWLRTLSTLVNQNKHNRLTPQTQARTREIRPGPGGAGFIGTRGAGIHLSGNAAIRISGNAGIRISGGGPPVVQNIVQTVYVDWLFDSPRVSVLSTLKEIQAGVTLLAGELRSLAGI